MLTDTLVKARQICAQYCVTSDVPSTASESEQKKTRKIRLLNICYCIYPVLQWILSEAEKVHGFLTELFLSHLSTCIFSSAHVIEVIGVSKVFFDGWQLILIFNVQRPIGHSAHFCHRMMSVYLFVMVLCSVHILWPTSELITWITVAVELSVLQQRVLCLTRQLSSCYQSVTGICTKRQWRNNT